MLVEICGVFQHSLSTYWTWNWTLRVGNILIVDLPCMFLEIKVPAEPLLTNMASVRLVIVVSVHVKGEVVNLAKEETQVK